MLNVRLNIDWGGGWGVLRGLKRPGKGGLYYFVFLRSRILTATFVFLWSRIEPLTATFMDLLCNTTGLASHIPYQGLTRSQKGPWYSASLSLQGLPDSQNLHRGNTITRLLPTVSAPTGSTTSVSRGDSSPTAMNSRQTLVCSVDYGFRLGKSDKFLARSKTRQILPALGTVFESIRRLYSCLDNLWTFFRRIQIHGMSSEPGTYLIPVCIHVRVTLFNLVISHSSYHTLFWI